MLRSLALPIPFSRIKDQLTLQTRGDSNHHMAFSYACFRRPLHPFYDAQNARFVYGMHHRRKNLHLA